MVRMEILENEPSANTLLVTVNEVMFQHVGLIEKIALLKRKQKEFLRHER